MQTITCVEHVVGGQVWVAPHIDTQLVRLCDRCSTPLTVYKFASPRECERAQGGHQVDTEVGALRCLTCGAVAKVLNG